MLPSLFTLAAAAATLLPVTSATPESGTVEFAFTKHRTAASPARLARRQTANVVLDNEEILYLINATVGTPPQSLSLQLDTGSSDIWFPAANSTYCLSSRTYGCSELGSYNSSASSTYTNPGYGDFEIQYVDGTDIQGQYVSDVFSLGGVTVTNLTMAEAYQTDQGYGIMGVGFAADESSDSGAGAFTYPNIIDVLVAEGKINKRAYSLWLDDLNSYTGSILFGGVDKRKYTGSLIAIPIQKDSYSGSYTSFTVAWTSLVLSSGSQTYNESPASPQPIILDSGTTLTLLPNDIANSIFNGVGVITDREYGNVVPCSLANDSLTFSFQFGGTSGPRVNVSISEFVLPLYTTSGSIPHFRGGPYNGQNVCQFGIEAAGTNPILFGDTFLRSAYVVYDLDNLEIGIAQTNRDGTSAQGDVQVFSSGTLMPDAATTVTSVLVSGSGRATNGPIVQTSATATGDAGEIATVRTATFSLASGTSTSTSSSSSAAAPGTIPSVQESTMATCGIVLVAFLFGTMVL